MPSALYAAFVGYGMSGLMYSDMLQWQAMSFLNHNDTIRYAITQQLLQSPGHGRPGFPGSDHQNAIIIFKLESALSNLQGAVHRLDISRNGRYRIHGLQGRPEDLLGLLPHGYRPFG
jgi:hypothetical protein